MSVVLEELRAKWDEARAAGSSDREWRGVALAVSAPIKLLAAVREADGKVSLLFETTLSNAPAHRIRFQANGISLLDQRRPEEDTMRLSLTLEAPELREIFEILALDLVKVAVHAASAQLAVRQSVRRLEAWQACLRIRQRGLNSEEQMGLVGELIVLERIALISGINWAVSIWCGPIAGLHDFSGGGIAVEAKTTIGVSHQIRIAHLDQLDSQGLQMLMLARVRLQESGQGTTLPERIRMLRTRIVDEAPNSTEEFAEKLMRAGYIDADADLYAGTRTVVEEVACYRVGDGFPRVIRASVPTAIVDASYSLDERQIASFKLTEEEFVRNVASAGV